MQRYRIPGRNPEVAPWITAPQPSDFRPMPEDRDSFGYHLAWMIHWDKPLHTSRELAERLSLGPLQLHQAIYNLKRSRQVNGQYRESKSMITRDWIDDRLSVIRSLAGDRWDAGSAAFMLAVSRQPGRPRRDKAGPGVAVTFERILNMGAPDTSRKDIAAHLGMSQSYFDALVNGRFCPSREWVAAHWAGLRSWHPPSWEQHAFEFAAQCNQLKSVPGKAYGPSPFRDFIRQVQSEFRVAATPILQNLSDGMTFRDPEISEHAGRLLSGDSTLPYSLLEAAAREIVGQKGVHTIDTAVLRRLGAFFPSLGASAEAVYRLDPA